MTEMTMTMTGAGTVRAAVPHTREFLADTLTPLGVYKRLRSVSDRSFLLESITGGEQVSRFSFIGCDPSVTCRLWPDQLEIENGGSVEIADRPPLEALEELLASVSGPAGELPLLGGWVGFFGYDTIRLVERLPDRPPDSYGLPLAALARFDNVVVFDHARQRVVAVANEIEGEISHDRALARLEELTDLLTSGGDAGAVSVPDHPRVAQTHPPSLSADEYQEAVRIAKRYIRAGDIFQVVPARRWRTLECPDALEVYRALRMVNPSPYMVLLEDPELTLVSASPEMVVRKTGDLLESRPIAGTRPRGHSPEEDHRLAEDLMADPKERAEHVMLVDLHRNDLGKVAKSASVHVPDFMIVEYYSHVMHLVSSVQATIRDGCSALEALLASFPAGTLSGAPKIRAMEIIDELEPEARGTLRRRDRLLLVLRRYGHLHHHPHDRHARRRGLGDGGRGHRRRLGSRDGGRRDREQGGSAAAGDRAGRQPGGGGAMILVVDNYDSFTYNLVQLLTGLGLEVEVRRNDVASPEELLALEPDAIVLSPGPGRPENAGVCVDLLRLRRPVPTLGVCLGHQALGYAFGADIELAPRLMHGKVSEVRHDGSGIFSGVASPFIATRYHSLRVSRNGLPECFEVLATSEGDSIMAMRHRELPYWGLQFHPESILTEVGPTLVAGFLEATAAATPVALGKEARHG